MDGAEKKVQAWLDALSHNANGFEVSLLNVAGRLRIPPGWHTAVRPLPNHLVYFAAEGAFDARLNGEARRIETGDLLWASRGTEVEFRLRPGEQLVVWRFRLRAADAAGAPLPSIQPFWHLRNAEACLPYLERILDEAAFPGPYAEPLVGGLVACLFVELLRGSGDRPERAGRLTNPQRSAIEYHCAQHPGQWPAPLELAELVKLSPDYFSRCFTKTYGVPPRRWLLRERMRLATVRLLETNSNILEIALQLGYRDVFLFSRQFKAVHGLSPKAYRHQHGAIAPAIDLGRDLGR